MIAIARHYDGITINEELEYVLTEDGELMKFESVDKAKEWLRRQDVDEETIEDLIYIEEV